VSTLPCEEQQTETSLVKPKPEDFNLPANAEDWNLMVARLVQLGLSNKEANASLEKRKRLFNSAMREFDGSKAPVTRKGRPKSRKNSLNDVQY
jgi:hypothetical protein